MGSAVKVSLRDALGPVLLAIAYAAAALGAPLDPALAFAAGPLVIALAWRPLRRPAVLLAAAAPLFSIAVRLGAAHEVRASCGCGPSLDGALLAAALIAGSRLSPARAAATALTPALAATIDLSGAGLRAMVATSSLSFLPAAAALPLLGAALLLMLAALSRRIGVPAVVPGLLGCAVLATGISWHGTLEVPLLTHVLENRAQFGATAVRLAEERLYERADLPSLAVLFRHVRDPRRTAVIAAAGRLGPAAEPLLERELTSRDSNARRAALEELGDTTRHGPLARRAAFLDAIATHHVAWPDGLAAPDSAAAAALHALESPQRESWWTAAMQLLRGGLLTRDTSPAVMDLARLAGVVPVTSPTRHELRMLWHPAEGVRLAAAAALALSPGGIGRAGEAPRVAQLLAEARANDAAASYDRARTPYGPSAPFRLLMFCDMVRRDTLGPAALEAARADPVPDIARKARGETVMCDGLRPLQVDGGGPAY